MNLSRRIALLLVFGPSLLDCTCKTTPPPWQAERFCPGQPGCPNGADGRFQVGAAKRDLTPKGYELVKTQYLMLNPECAPARCGEMVEKAFADCGTDMLCRNDPGYPGPDADGTEGDGILDFFYDCGRDRLCPGDPGYPGPDADGSEHDGKFQGFWLAGFGNNRPMLSSHDPIWARALAFKNGDVTVGLVVIDAVGIFYEREVQSIRQRVADLGVDIDYLYVAATHVHEAPDTLGQWGIFSNIKGQGRGVDEAWLTGVVDSAAAAVAEAVQNARPATATFASTGTGFDGWVEDGRDPQIVDDTLVAARFDDAGTGAPIASLVNWASHPETLSDSNNACTSDYPNYLRQAMEQGLPATSQKPALAAAGGMAVFLNGPLGGIIGPLGAHPVDRNGVVHSGLATFAKAQAIGENAAERALLALAAATPMNGDQLPVAFKAQSFNIYMDNLEFMAAMNLGLFTRPMYGFDSNAELTPQNTPQLHTEIGVMTIGPAVFMSLPGEAFPELVVGGYHGEHSFEHPMIRAGNPNPPDLSKAPGPPYLQDLFPSPYFVRMGLTNDEVGYFVPPYTFELNRGDPYFSQALGDHYEETNSLGPRTVPTLLEVYEKLSQFTPKPVGQ